MKITASQIGWFIGVLGAVLACFASILLDPPFEGWFLKALGTGHCGSWGMEGRYKIGNEK